MKDHRVFHVNRNRNRVFSCKWNLENIAYFVITWEIAIDTNSLLWLVWEREEMNISQRDLHLFRLTYVRVRQDTKATRCRWRQRKPKKWLSQLIVISLRGELALFQCFPQNSLLLRTTATKNKQRKTNHKKQPTLKPTGFVNWLSRGHQRLEDF